MYFDIASKTELVEHEKLMEDLKNNEQMIRKRLEDKKKN